MIRSAPRFETTRRNLLRYRYFYLMLIPVILWYVVFCYAPMYGVVTAFQDFQMHKGIGGSAWVGTKHFRALLKDLFFWRALRNSVAIAAMRLVFEFPVPILLAVLLNELRGRRFKQAVQTVVYLPHFLSWVICASIIFTVFNADDGLFTVVMHNVFGLPMQNYVTPTTFRRMLILTNLWKEAGWEMIIFLASMAAIDPTLYEAAVVDGAHRWRRIWHITLPGIRSVIVIVLILRIGSILNTGFDQVFNLQKPLVLETGDIIDTYVLRTAMKDAKFSYAAAVGLFNSIINTALLLLANWGAKLSGQQSIF